MSQIEQHKRMPKLDVEETFEEQARAMVSIPKKQVYNYKFTHWQPMHPDQYPTETYPCPVLWSPELTVLFMLSKSKKCQNCKKTILPRPSKNYELSKICPYCKYDPTKQKQKSSEIKLSSLMLRLRSLVDSAFIKYYQYTDFLEKNDYTANFYHKQNVDIYLKDTIINDAQEVTSIIDRMISFEHYPPHLFNMNSKSYRDYFNEILDSEDIIRIKPFYQILVIASSFVKGITQEIVPVVRGPRTSPANVTNVSGLNQTKPTTENKSH